MTRQQLTDPFGSDDEDEQALTASSPPKSAARPAETTRRSESTESFKRDSQVPSLLVIASPTETEPEVSAPPPSSKQEDLKERARRLIEQTKREASNKALTKQSSQVFFQVLLQPVTNHKL